MVHHRDRRWYLRRHRRHHHMNNKINWYTSFVSFHTTSSIYRCGYEPTTPHCRRLETLLHSKYDVNSSHWTVIICANCVNFVTNKFFYQTIVFIGSNKSTN
ncbi:bro9 [Heliothis virescens ascovirus 3i]|nr:bro9 [Heliothis virescens ascovirus 3i]